MKKGGMFESPPENSGVEEKSSRRYNYGETRITSASNNVAFLFLRRIYLSGEEGVNLILIPSIFFCV